MLIYIVVMRRYGSYESHSYILGVWEDLTTATRAAEEEQQDRGGKYEYEILIYDTKRPTYQQKYISTCDHASGLLFEQYSIDYVKKRIWFAIVHKLIKIFKLKMADLFYKKRKKD